ncbi:maleate cis-trans isomerase family protein [Methylobacterium nodulans]|uniref:Asp/Glu/hydantoin racemase n=1 Tax=Methylobacterium nodulans (strain LMG 21967 / CNCM I-2342 / ORS 2060) TaxID=460265 RepID=B8IGK9_METNO|nr:aspartate/glutamate racemase family protein [Methylobacterium nodulans]ACL55909.1 Asp/Glu/hydantoin racemase [Methylobacterium nodulans ORS 2060]
MPRTKRIGLLIPSTNTAVEADFQRLNLPGVSVHGQRLHIPDGVMGEDVLDRMNQDLDEAIESLASAHVDAMVYACTSGSFYKGAGWDTDVITRIERKGLPAVATSPAVSAALRHVGGRAISVVTPYPEWTNRRLRDYFTSEGFNILGVAGDPSAAAGGHSFINDQDPENIVAFGERHCAPEADVLFCSCTAWRSFEAVPELEKRLRRPVISSNQATVWAALQAVGFGGHIRNGGRLFAT